MTESEKFKAQWEKFKAWQRKHPHPLSHIFDSVKICEAADTGPLEGDPVRQKPSLERKHEWQHGDGGDKDCKRKDKPVYTNPGVVPGTCKGWTCDNDEWYSKGIVIRERNSKEIVSREK